MLQAKKLSAPKVAVEIATVKVASPENSNNVDELLLRIEKLEKTIDGIKSGEVSVRKSSSNRSFENRTLRDIAG